MSRRSRVREALLLILVVEQAVEVFLDVRITGLVEVAS
jgi:hypothetical protein